MQEQGMKGQASAEIFKQTLCFMPDGASLHLVHFDAPKKDPGYDAVIETPPGAISFLALGHTILQKVLAGSLDPFSSIFSPDE